MKKILAGVLAAASILSVSAAAFADGDTASDGSYNVSAGVGYGSTSITWPTINLKKDVIINPYGAAITSKDVTGSPKNSGAVASPVFTIENTDATNAAKIMATVSVTKVTNMVIVDGQAEMPTGWSATDNLKKDTEDATADNKVVHSTDPNGGTWSPLSNYDKLTVSKKQGSADSPVYVGGGLSSKQSKNVGLALVGNATPGELFEASGALDKTKIYDKDDNPTGTTKAIYFAPKGTVTGDLGEAAASAKLYFSVYGELNPNLPETTTWDEAKDNISISIVFKAVPV